MSTDTNARTAREQNDYDQMTDWQKTWVDRNGGGHKGMVAWRDSNEQMSDQITGFGKAYAAWQKDPKGEAAWKKSEDYQTYLEWKKTSHDHEGESEEAQIKAYMRQRAWNESANIYVRKGDKDDVLVPVTGRELSGIAGSKHEYPKDWDQRRADAEALMPDSVKNWLKDKRNGQNDGYHDYVPPPAAASTALTNTGSDSLFSRQASGSFARANGTPDGVSGGQPAGLSQDSQTANGVSVLSDQFQKSAFNLRPDLSMIHNGDVVVAPMSLKSLPGLSDQTLAGAALNPRTNIDLSQTN